MDGGKVVLWVDLAIATGEVLGDNPEMGREGLVDRLGRDLGQAELIVVSREPYITFGQADEMVAWLNGLTVLGNDD